MSISALATTRMLSDIEIVEVSGGCQMGPKCNCPGSTHDLSPDGGTCVTNACDGSIWLTHSYFTFLLAA